MANREAIQCPVEDPLVDHDRYQTVKYLSSGSYGFVVLARDQTKRETDEGYQVAIKFIERIQGKITKNVEREILNHSLLIHPHVVRFYECFLTAKHLAIAMEYAAGGTMYNLVTAPANLGLREDYCRLDYQQIVLALPQRTSPTGADLVVLRMFSLGLREDHCRFYYQQIILALDYCHKMSISNRDIKLENTLLDSTRSNRNPLIKLCDFGYSINESHSLPKTAVGTPGYTAPEVLQRKRGYDAKQADVWSSGVMLFAMLCCSYPFERPEDERDPRGHHNVVRRILTADYAEPRARSRAVSAECKDLIQKIFQPDPTARITIAGIQQHPWFQQGMPANLDVDAYNSYWVNLSREAPDNSAAIKRVVEEALNEGGQPDPDNPEQSHEMLDSDLELEDEFEL